LKSCSCGMSQGNFLRGGKANSSCSSTQGRLFVY
jgi:hypothetical protein